MNRHQEATRERHERKALEADPLAFAVKLIKEHGAEKARPMFLEKITKHQGPEWAKEAEGLFDNLAVHVADGTCTVRDGGELPQELAKAMIRGDIPSNASEPGVARDSAMGAIKAPTNKLQ